MNTQKIDVLAVPQFPGPWTVRAERPWGFEITRALGGHRSEWLCDKDGESLVFGTAEEARTALASIGGAP